MFWGTQWLPKMLWKINNFPPLHCGTWLGSVSRVFIEVLTSSSSSGSLEREQQQQLLAINRPEAEMTMLSRCRILHHVTFQNELAPALLQFVACLLGLCYCNDDGSVDCFLNGKTNILYTVVEITDILGKYMYCHFSDFNSVRQLKQLAEYICTGYFLSNFI